MELPKNEHGSFAIECRRNGVRPKLSVSLPQPNVSTIDVAAKPARHMDIASSAVSVRQNQSITAFAVTVFRNHQFPSFCGVH
jgi:hypothetical protein